MERKEFPVHPVIATVGLYVTGIAVVVRLADKPTQGIAQPLNTINTHHETLVDRIESAVRLSKPSDNKEPFDFPLPAQQSALYTTHYRDERARKKNHQYNGLKPTSVSPSITAGRRTYWARG